MMRIVTNRSSASVWNGSPNQPAEGKVVAVSPFLFATRWKLSGPEMPIVAYLRICGPALLHPAPTPVALVIQCAGVIIGRLSCLSYHNGH